MKMKGLSVEEYKQIVPDNTILLGYRGSIAHGTYLRPDDPNSVDDKDIMGVCIAPLEQYFGLQQFEQKEVMLREWDSVVYEFLKFMRLLVKSNPNVLNMLWLRPQDYIVKNDLGRELVNHRNLFVTKQIYQSFTGYAYGQLKKMSAFHFAGYMGAKRKALVEKYGYDVKNASHCIRILRMGIEFLREGELHVYRHDAPQLVEIKTGKWTLEQVKKEADHLFKRAETAYDDCKFPTRPDIDKVNALAVDILGRNFMTKQQIGLGPTG